MAEQEDWVEKGVAMIEALFEMDDGNRQGALVVRKHVNNRAWCESCGK
jgi:hypothetical protein